MLFLSIEVESCALIFQFLSFGLHLDRLLFVDHFGIGSQFEALSFPRPPPVSLYRYHAGENRHVGPASTNPQIQSAVTES